MQGTLKEFLDLYIPESETMLRNAVSAAWYAADKDFDGKPTVLQLKDYVGKALLDNDLDAYVSAVDTAFNDYLAKYYAANVNSVTAAEAQIAEIAETAKVDAMDPATAAIYTAAKDGKESVEKTTGMSIWLVLAIVAVILFLIFRK